MTDIFWSGKVNQSHQLLAGGDCLQVWLPGLLGVTGFKQGRDHSDILSLNYCSHNIPSGLRSMTTSNFLKHRRDFRRATTEINVILRDDKMNELYFALIFFTKSDRHCSITSRPPTLLVLVLHSLMKVATRLHY